MRNFKILGLGLVAMLSMSVVGASLASADDLTSELNQAVTLHATNEPAQPDVLVTTVGNATCKEVTYDIGTVTMPTTTVTVLPTYPVKNKAGEQNCFLAGIPATVLANGCHYLFHVTGGTSTVGDVTLSCAGTNEITVTSSIGGTHKCILHVASQTLTGDPVTYTNIGAGTTREITVKVNAHGLSYKHTPGTGIGACPNGSAVNGTFEGRGTLTANNHANTAHVGLFLTNL